MAPGIKGTFISVFFSLRWPNLMLTLLSLLISYFFLLQPIHQQMGVVSSLDLTNFMLLAVSTLFIMAGGYVINDLTDIESDLINQKAHSVIGVPRKLFLTFYFLFSLGGLLLSLWLSFRLENMSLWSVFLLSFVSLLLYSKYLKSTPLAGNMLIAILCGLVPMLPLIFDQGLVFFHINSDYLIFHFLGFFGLLLTLIRELVKDMEDEIGDRKMNVTTFPVVFGLQASRWTCFIFFMLFLVLMTAMLYLVAGRDMISLFYLIVLVLCPALWLSYTITIAQTKQDFHKISRYLKYIMLTGMIYGIVYYFANLR